MGSNRDVSVARQLMSSTKFRETKAQLLLTEMLSEMTGILLVPAILCKVSPKFTIYRFHYAQWQFQPGEDYDMLPALASALFQFFLELPLRRLRRNHTRKSFFLGSVLSALCSAIAFDLVPREPLEHSFCRPFDWGYVATKGQEGIVPMVFPGNLCDVCQQPGQTMSAEMEFVCGSNASS